MQRRQALRSIAAAAGAALPWLWGCASLRPFPQPRIVDEAPAGLRPILAPGPIVKAASAPARVVDVHAHFFNARDVPVEGYLAGPVAHGRVGDAAELIRKLAPLADRLAVLAPDAFTEYRSLIQHASGARMKSMSASAVHSDLSDERLRHLASISPQVFQILQGTPFEHEFNAQQARLSPQTQSKRGPAAARLNPLSLSDAMRSQRQPVAAETTAQAAAASERDPDLHTPADGVLAFLGHMLSYRWMNLLAYQQAYSTDAGAFGVDQVYGALVDFDHWLMPPPRVAHEDQVRLHQLLSTLSGGYMKPLVAYNPWSDVIGNGIGLERVREALQQRGFVGVKLYPPNGFRPWGNTASPLLVTPHAPAADLLDEALLAMWQACAALGVPVMAHGGHSMGSDDAHEDMADPLGWARLLDKLSPGPRPVINVGHFGGDAAVPAWTEALAALMERPMGGAMYGDLGYWSKLRCNGDDDDCGARDRLRQVLTRHPVVTQRVMYGSDWLMLSQEPRWERFPFDIAASTASWLDQQALFAGNADTCFRSPAPG